PARPRAAAPTTASPSPTVPAATAAGTRGAGPLHGVPLQGPTGLRLLVADVPAPFVLDVDRGTTQPITGLPPDGDRGIGLLPLGEDALVLSYPLCDHCRPAPGVYLVRRGATAAAQLGTDLQVAAARDGQGVWVLGRRDPSHCTIGEVGLDGRRRAARPVPCATELVAELPAGLLVSYAAAGGSDPSSAVLKPDGGRMRLRGPRPQPVVGDLVLSGANPSVPLVLTDVGSGVSRRLSWPSRPDYSLGEVTADPSGRLAVVEFANAAQQRLDLWLLDTATRRWRHLPEMPAPLSPKATHVQWTADGRVVLLARAEIAVWRPGEPRFAVRQVKPPKQPDRRFVLW
ncbi:MAG TPA: hypothetical protein VF880_20555, partial [Actinomycetes bacterium]